MATATLGCGGRLSILRVSDHGGNSTGKLFSDTQIVTGPKTTSAVVVLFGIIVYVTEEWKKMT